MVLSKANAALVIGLLVLQESEARPRPGLPLHIFLQMPGDHQSFCRFWDALVCSLTSSKAFSRRARNSLAYSVCSCAGSRVFPNITSIGRRISLPNMRWYGVNFVVSWTLAQYAISSSGRNSSHLSSSCVRMLNIMSNVWFIRFYKAIRLWMIRFSIPSNSPTCVKRWPSKFAP